MTSALACWLLWLLVRPGPAAQPRRPEILRLATAYELYGGGSGAYVLLIQFSVLVVILTCPTSRLVSHVCIILSFCYFELIVVFLQLTPRLSNDFTAA